MWHVSVESRSRRTLRVPRDLGGQLMDMSIPVCAATLDWDYPISSACLAVPPRVAHILHTRRSIVAVFSNRLYEFSVDVVAGMFAVYQSHGAAHYGIGSGLPAG